MKALLCTRYGTADDLELTDIAEPVPKPGEAVVRVKAAALNFFDTLIIAGKYQHKPAFPFSPAAEFAGEVESIGEGVTGLAPGDRVIGNIGWGAAREKVAVAADQLVAMPAGLDFDRAAGLTVTYGTTMHALNDRAKLKAGETLAVLGAAGGTGLAAVEIGKLMGARVIACASSDDKIAFAKAARRRRRRELCHRRSQGRAARAHRRQGRRRGLRSDRRRAGRSRVARHGLGRALSGDRLCRRRPAEAAAQSGAAAQLRRARRLLGRLDCSATRKAIAPT